MDRLSAWCGEERYHGNLDRVRRFWAGEGRAIVSMTSEHAYYRQNFNDEEVLDAVGSPLPGWSGEGKAAIRANTFCRNRLNDGTVCWPDGRSMDQLKGQTIRLRFHLRHARLFTFQAGMGGGANDPI